MPAPQPTADCWPGNPETDVAARLRVGADQPRGQHRREHRGPLHQVQPLDEMSIAQHLASAPRCDGRRRTACRKPASAHCQPPQRSDFPGARRMQRIARIGGLGMARPHLVAPHHAQARRLDQAGQLAGVRAGPDARPGRTGSASLRRRVPGARRARPESRAACGCPGRRSRVRAANSGAPAATADCRPPAARAPAETGRPRTTSTCPLSPQPLDVVPGAGQRARVLVGGDHVPHAAARQDGREHAGSGADVEGQLVRRQRRVGDQVQVFAAHRREHAVMRMDAVVRRRSRARAPRAPSCATHARRPVPAVRAATPPTAGRRAGPRPRCRPGAGRGRAAARCA